MPGAAAAAGEPKQPDFVDALAAPVAAAVVTHVANNPEAAATAAGKAAAGSELGQSLSLHKMQWPSIFFGFGQKKPFAPPKCADLVKRVRGNLAFFSANYLLLAIVMGIMTAFSNPLCCIHV